jgi:hypothetical protein
MRPDELERRLRERLDAFGPARRAELLHVLMLPTSIAPTGSASSILSSANLAVPRRRLGQMRRGKKRARSGSEVLLLRQED